MSEGEWGGLWRIKGMDIDSIGTGAGPSFLEGPGTVNSVSGLILSSNLLYNLYSFAQDSVHWKNNFSLKMAYVEQKNTYAPQPKT